VSGDEVFGCVSEMSMATQSAFEEDDLERLLASLDSDKTVAAAKYEDLRRKLLRFLYWNHSVRAEELTDETFNRVAAKLKVEVIENMSAYALTVARFVLLEDSKYHRESSIDAMPEGVDSIVEPVDSERKIVEHMDHLVRIECLRDCRTKLPPADSAFVLAYYSAEGEKQKDYRRRLAQTLRMTMTALRVRANRLRDKLEPCVIVCVEKRRRAFALAYDRRQGSP
jgi:hypothetical protein